MVQLNASRSYEEKRDFVRVIVSTPLLFTANNLPEKHEGLCRDLSGAGLLIETTKKLKIGDRLHVTIPPAQHQKAQLDAIAEVVRIDPKNERFTFQAGAIIKQIIA